MQLSELFILAIDALKSNVIRTLLTMLGIIIGIASVIAIISLGEGTTKSIVDRISSFGANLLNVRSGKPRGFGHERGNADTLTQGDADAIYKLDNIQAVSSVVEGSKTITNGAFNISNAIMGVEPSYQTVHDITIYSGAFFSKNQNTSISKVAIMGMDLTEDLFGEILDPVGKTVRIDGKVFRIIGSIENSSDIYVPISTATKLLFGKSSLDSIAVKVVDNKMINQTQDAITNLLLERHKIANADNADFNIQNFQDMISSVSSVTGTMTAMLSGIAAISLLVGGIGIMNIMLVTVTERTKEIGLLKSIGAKRKDILSQFLIESLVLTLISGGIGMIIGMIVAYFASSAMSIPFVISLKGIFLSVGVSASIGIGFGWYPAQKAAKLQPIDALRYE